MLQLTSARAAQGKAVRIERYGVFVDVENPHASKVSGLIHISQLSKKRVENCEDVVSLGAPSCRDVCENGLC